MTPTARPLLATALVALLTPLIGSCTDPSENVDSHAIDLELHEAPLDEVYALLGELADVEIVLDPCVAGTIDIELHHAPLGVVFDVIGAGAGLETRYEGDTVHVGCASDRRDEPERIDIALEDVPIADVYTLMGNIAGVEFVLDPCVEGTVTLELENAPVDTVLDLLAEMQALELREVDGAVHLDCRR